MMDSHKLIISRLNEAIRRDNIKKVEQIIEEEASEVNWASGSDFDGWNPIGVAITRNAKESILYLLERGAPKKSDIRSGLIGMCSSGNSSEAAEELLKFKGIDEIVSKKEVVEWMWIGIEYALGLGVEPNLKTLNFLIRTNQESGMELNEKWIDRWWKEESQSVIKKKGELNEVWTKAEKDSLRKVLINQGNVIRQQKRL